MYIYSSVTGLLNTASNNLIAPFPVRMTIEHSTLEMCSNMHKTLLMHIK